MNIHNNARLTFRGRELLVKRIVEQGLRVEEAAQASGVSVRTAYKWLRRYRQEGITGLYDRSSRPRHCPHQTSAHRHQEIVRLRRLRRTYRQISRQLGVSQSTVGRVLPKLGLNRLSALEPAQPVNRYQHEHPGDLLHLDIKKLGRFKRPGHRVTGNRQQNSRHSGWEYVHVAIDDASRIAFSSVHADETGRSACRALLSALRYYRSLGITHKRTRPYTPRTNGKAERFIQTALREWAYARSYRNSSQRARELPRWMHYYNWHRQHAGIDYQCPINTLGINMNNLLALHS